MLTCILTFYRFYGILIRFIVDITLWGGEEGGETMRRTLSARRGIAAVEYALLLALIVVLAIGAWCAVGGKLTAMVSDTTSGLAVGSSISVELPAE